MRTKQLRIVLGLAFGLVMTTGVLAPAAEADPNQDSAAPNAARQDDARRGALGVSFNEQNGRVRVSAVVADGPAARAGIRVGDDITRVGTANIRTAQQLIAEIVSRQPGTHVQLVIRRGGQQLTARTHLVSIEELNAIGGVDRVGHQLRVLQRQVSLLEQQLRDSRQQIPPVFEGNGDNGWFWRSQPGDINQGLHDYGARARDGQ